MVGPALFLAGSTRQSLSGRQVLSAVLSHSDHQLWYIGQGHFLFNATVLHGFCWHPVDHRRCLILADRVRPSVTHLFHSAGAVIAHARHDDPDGIRTRNLRCGTEKHIDGRAVAVDQRPVLDLDPVVGAAPRQQHVFALKRGAMRHRMQASLYGGANVVPGLTGIGAQNARFGCQFVQDEGFALVARCVGGKTGRRVWFHPATGRGRSVAFEIDKVDPSLGRGTVVSDPTSGTTELF